MPTLQEIRAGAFSAVNKPTPGNTPNTQSNSAPRSIEAVREGAFKAVDPVNRPKVTSTLVKEITPIEEPKRSVFSRVKEAIKSGVAGIPSAIGSAKAGIGTALDNVAVETSNPRQLEAQKFIVSNSQKVLDSGEAFKWVNHKLVKTALTPEDRKRYEKDLQVAQKKVRELQTAVDGDNGISTKLKESGAKDIQKSQEERQKVVKEFGEPRKWSGQWVANEVLANTPQFLASFGVGVATAVVTKNPQVALSVGFSTSYAQEAGGAYLSAKEAGLSESQAQDIGNAVGVGNALIEQIPLANFLKKAPSEKVVKDALLVNLRNYILERSAEGGFEGATESMQEILSNVAKKTYDENTKLFEGTKESFVVGFFLGMFGGAISGDGIQRGVIDPEAVEKANQMVEEAIATPKELRTPDQQVIVDSVVARETSTPQAPKAVGSETATVTEVKPLGTETKVFRGTTKIGEALDVTKPNGLTKGESTSISKEVAQRFATKKGGEVQEYTISKDAKVVEHSYLENLVKEEKDIAKKREIVDKFIQDNNVDVVRFDVPEGSQGEGELRIINPKVLKGEGSSGMDTILNKEGWEGGDAQKAEFDLALLQKDAETVKKLLSKVPEYYKERFAKEIDAVLGAKEITPTEEVSRVDRVLNREKELAQLEKGSAKERKLKGLGMEYSAIKRALDGNPTQIEESNARKYLDSNHAGKEVLAEGSKGTLTGKTSFGRHEVSFTDGTTKYVEGSRIKSTKATRGDILKYLKKQAEAKISSREEIFSLDKESTGEVVKKENPIQKETKQTPKSPDRGTQGREESAKSPEKILEEKVEDYVKNRTVKFRTTDDVTTTILEELGNRETVSKQFISDLTNKGSVKQIERDLIRKTLEKYPDKVDVNSFKADVIAELLPLNVVGQNVTIQQVEEAEKLARRTGNWNAYEELQAQYEDSQLQGGGKYESVALPDNIRGDIESYKENVYESPIETKAGGVHFGGLTDSYFGHTRIEDMADGKTRRVIEVQSDLYQKGNLEKELDPELYIPDVEQPKSLEQRRLEKAKLFHYANPTAHFRMVREEMKSAFLDGKDKVLFPTGETGMKIEGLVNRADKWVTLENEEITDGSNITEGQVISFRDETGQVHEYRRFIVTKNNKDGTFRAVDMLTLENDQVGYDALNKYTDQETGDITLPDMLPASFIKKVDSLAENLSALDTVDKENAIYKFYDKTLSKYLKSKYNAQEITDENGVTWMEAKVTKDMGNPVEAFRVKDDVKRITGKTITDEQEAELIALNKRLFGDENVKITMQIMANKSALGSHKDGIIQIVDGQADPKDTFYHEAVHKHIDVFTTKQEQVELFKAGIERYGTDDLLTVEERIAEDFIAYAKKREGVTGKLQMLFDTILRRVQAYLGNSDAIDKLYRDILTPASQKSGNFPEGSGRVKESAFLERVKEQLLSTDPTTYEFDDLTGKYNEMNLEENAKRAVTFLENNPEEAVAVSLGFQDAPAGTATNSAISIATMIKAREEGNFNLYKDIATSTTLRLTRLGQEIVSVRGQMNDDSPENFVRRVIDARMKKLAGTLVTGAEFKGRSLVDSKKVVTNKIQKETAKLKQKLTKDQQKVKLAQDIIDALRC